jgi:hypothetical protein
MNKELLAKEIELTKITDVLVGDEIVFKFENGKELKINCYHRDDCCENVYADFSIFKYLIKDLIGKQISNIVIKGVEDMGFLVCLGLKEKWRDTIDNYSKVFVPCYNYQNGYYSDNLELQLSYDGVEIKIDISDMVEDYIN